MPVTGGLDTPLRKHSGLLDHRVALFYKLFLRQWRKVIVLTLNQGLAFGAAPVLDLFFAVKCVGDALIFFGTDQFDGQPPRGVACAQAGLMFPETAVEVFGRADVIGTVCAFEDIHPGHKTVFEVGGRVALSGFSCTERRTVCEGRIETTCEQKAVDCRLLVVSIRRRKTIAAYSTSESLRVIPLENLVINCQQDLFGGRELH